MFLNNISFGIVALKILVVVVIIVTFITVYTVINPKNYSSLSSNNHQAFPLIKSPQLPDTETISTSYNIQTCPGNTACPENFDCINTGPSTQDTDLNQDPIEGGSNYVLNGITLNSNTNYCMPSTNTDTPVCNKFTGKYTVSNNNWSCIPLYPSLFGGESSREQLACMNETGGLIGQTYPKPLVSTTALQTFPPGTVWNPLFSHSDHTKEEIINEMKANIKNEHVTSLKFRNPIERDQYVSGILTNNQFNIEANSDELNMVKYYSNVLNQYDILRIPPDGRDETTGDPWFACKCNIEDEGVPSGSGLIFNRLENDPYHCHLDKCWVNNFFAYPALNVIPGDENGECEGGKCECKCTDKDGINIKYGSDKGRCVPANQLCKEIVLYPTCSPGPVQGDCMCGSVFCKGGSSCTDGKCVASKGISISNNEIEDVQGGQGSWNNSMCDCPTNSHNRSCINDIVTIKEMKTNPDDFTKLQPCNPDDDDTTQCFGTKCIRDDNALENEPQGYCACNNAYNNMGSECVSPCAPSPCKNGSLCTSTVDSSGKYIAVCNCDSAEKVYNSKGDPATLGIDCAGNPIDIQLSGEHCNIMTIKSDVAAKSLTQIKAFGINFNANPSCDIDTQLKRNNITCKPGTTLKKKKVSDHSTLGTGYDTYHWTCQ